MGFANPQSGLAQLEAAGCSPEHGAAFCSIRAPEAATAPVTVAVTVAVTAAVTAPAPEAPAVTAPVTTAPAPAPAAAPAGAGVYTAASPENPAVTGFDGSSLAAGLSELPPASMVATVDTDGDGANDLPVADPTAATSLLGARPVAEAVAEAIGGVPEAPAQVAAAEAMGPAAPTAGSP